MHLKGMRFAILALALVAVNAGGIVWIHHDLTAGPRPRLRVLECLPKDGIDTADRLALVFDEALAKADLLGKPLDRSPFVLNPAAPGHWQWASAERLEYILHRPLPPGRVFTVTPAGDLEAQTGRKLVGDSRFQFRTSCLALMKCQQMASDRKNVALELTFNQPVHPQDLLAHVSVKDAASNQGLTVTAITHEPAVKTVVHVLRPPSGKLTLTLDEGLKGHQAELGLDSPASIAMEVGSRFCLLRAEADAPGLEKQIEVKLCFSRKLDPKQPERRVIVRPAVKDLCVTRFSDGLSLRAPFDIGRTYKATVSADLLAADGQALGEPQYVTFEVPSREPTLHFAVDEGILSPKGKLCLDVNLANVGSLAACAWRLHANNLVAHLNGQDHGETSRSLPEKTFKLDVPRNVPATMMLDLRTLVGPSPMGVYRVRVKPASDPQLPIEHWSAEDSAIVCVSDLAITAKRHRGGYLAWVTSLTSAKPVAGARVTALTQTNQVLASATTDESGLAILPIRPGGPDGNVWLLTAERGEDLGFLRPDQRPWVIEEVDQSGRQTPGTYDVMLYCERGIYRPGETVHLGGIVRTAQGQVPPPFPLSIAVIRPDGRKLTDLIAHVQPGGQGVFHADYVTSEAAWTGQYSFKASLPGASETLGHAEAVVEPFVPVRMEVKASALKSVWGPKEPPQVDVTARYLFGQAACDLPVSMAGTCRRVAYRSTAFSDYVFDQSDTFDQLPYDRRHFNTEQVTAALDAKGHARLQLKPISDAPKGLWNAELSATVSELGGRSVSANVSFAIDTIDRHVGLHMPAQRFVAVDTPTEIPWVVVSGQDRPVAPSATLEIALSRVEWDWVVEEVNHDYVWKCQERLIPVSSFKLSGAQVAQAKGSVQIACPRAGLYRLMATDKASGSTTAGDFYARGRDEETGGNLVNKPERLELVLDQETYVPGSLAKVIVRSPFPGTMLLTLETDQVLQQVVTTLSEKSKTVELPVPATLRGGAFVTATVIRAVDTEKEKWLPHRAMGMVRLATDHSAHRIPVAISASSRVQGGQRIRVAVTTDLPTNPSAPPMVGLWAVDEGILLTTGYSMPDPLEHFFAPRGLGVETSDVLADLMPDYKRPATIGRIGAGEGKAELRGMRLNPVPLKHRASAVIWQSCTQVGPDGHAEFDLDLPDQTGELCLMAIAVDQDRYGSTQQPLTLSSPMMVEASWPRFAAPGDTFVVPVKVFNTTSREAFVLVTAHYRGNIKFLTGDPKGDPRPDGQGTFQNLDTLVIRAGASQTSWVTVVAGDEGEVKVSIEANTIPGGAGSLSAHDTSEFSIRALTPLHSVVRTLRLPIGKDMSIDPLDMLIPGSVRTTVCISGRPGVDLRPAIERLIDYPYGCVEQTTSRLYPLLYAPDLLNLSSDSKQTATQDASGKAQDPRSAMVRDMVKAGIVRLWSMQTRDGGLSYWPGGGESHLWGSTYAAACLAQAKRAGYEVDKRFSDELLRYLQAAMDNQGDSGQIDDNMRAQICFTLAAFERPPLGWMSHLAERPDKLDIAGRAYLAGAYLEAGRKDICAKILPEGTVGLNVRTTTAGRLASQVQQEAVLLGVLLDLDARHLWIPELVRKLDKARAERGYWGSTVENAACLASLARYQLAQASEDEKTDFAGTFLLPDGAEKKFDHTRAWTFKFRQGEKPATIRAQGKGTAYVSIQSEGLLKKGRFETYDRNLQVRREWKDRTGNTIDPSKLKVGDLLKVDITCQALTGQQVDNIAIVDGLPAGVEVESPSLITSAKGDQSQQAPSRIEFLDDRVIMFVSADSKIRTYSYYLRVISPGSFELPPVQASCMYDAGCACVHGGGRVTVAR